MQTESYVAFKAGDKRQKTSDKKIQQRLPAGEISVHRLIDTFYNAKDEAILIIQRGSRLIREHLFLSSYEYQI